MGTNSGAHPTGYAADKGININLEVVNRYETNIMNTGLEGSAWAQTAVPTLPAFTVAS